MSSFDPTGPLPTGTTLLEAGAGTGKTHAVAGLEDRRGLHARPPPLAAAGHAAAHHERLRRVVTHQAGAVPEAFLRRFVKRQYGDFSCNGSSKWATRRFPRRLAKRRHTCVFRRQPEKSAET